MSTAILKLAEDGELQKIHDKWFCKMDCPEERSSNSGHNQLHLISFWGLYLSCGVVSLAALWVFLLRTICQYVKKQKQKDISSSSSSDPSVSHCSHAVHGFFNFIDEKDEASKKVFTQCDTPSTSTSTSRVIV